MKWQKTRVTVSGKKQVKIVIGAYNDAIMNGLVGIVGSTARTIASKARSGARAGLSGMLAAGIKSSKVHRGKRSITARVTSNAPYSSAVEFGGWKGTKGKSNFKQPPSRAFLGYAEQRLGLSGALAERAAFLIARKVAKQGLAKRPFLGPAYVEVRPRFYSRVYNLLRSQGPALVTRRVNKSLVTKLVE